MRRAEAATLLHTVKECGDSFCALFLRGELISNFLKRFPLRNKDVMNLTHMICPDPSFTAQKHS